MDVWLCFIDDDKANREWRKRIGDVWMIGVVMQSGWHAVQDACGILLIGRRVVVTMHVSEYCNT